MTEIELQVVRIIAAKRKKDGTPYWTIKAHIPSRGEVMLNTLHQCKVGEVLTGIIKDSSDPHFNPWFNVSPPAKTAPPVSEEPAVVAQPPVAEEQPVVEESSKDDWDARWDNAVSGIANNFRNLSFLLREVLKGLEQ